MKILYKEDMDKIFNGRCMCDVCRGKSEYRHANCHAGGAMKVRYNNGVLEVRCRVCDGVVVAVKVAERHLRPIGKEEKDETRPLH